MIGVAWGFDPSRVALGASMGSAQITAVRNAVEKVENEKGRPAVVSDSVVEGDMVRTRSESLAELTFSDKTITRMGSNSQFSYTSQERLVKIEKGTVLMHTPPGNGGATITSGGVTGAISGTSFLLTANPAVCTKKPCQKQLRERTQETDPLKRYYCEDHPDAPQTPSTGGFAIVVLEGKNVTKVTGPNGMTVELQPGQMAVVGPAMEGAPRVFTVDLATIIRTSPLIQAFPNPLPSIGDIVQMAIQQQRPQFKDLDLTGKALSEDGDILVGPSDPPSPFKPDFEMASNTDGSGQKLPNSLDEDIDTAAGVGGGTPFTGPTPPPPAPPAPPTPPVPPPPSPFVGPTPPSPNPPPAGLTVVNTLALDKVYDGTRNASIVGAALSGAIQLGVALANDTSGLFASKNVSISQPVATAMTLTGPNAGVYTLTQPTLTAAITAKDVGVFNAVAQSKVYDGTRSAVVAGGVLVAEAPGTGSSTDLKVYTGDEVTLGGATSGQFVDKNVGSWSVTTAMNLSGGDAFNYNLIEPTLTAAITAKDLTLASASVVTKTYDATTAASLSGTSLQAAIAPGSGSSTDGKPYSGDVLSIGNNTSGTFERSLPGTGIPVTHAMALGGGDAGNYNLVIPQFTGEITGTATLNQDGAALNVSSASFLHIRDTTANRMQDGLSINSTGGKVLLENCTFDGWMQKRITPFVISDFGYGLTTFEETANVAVTAPVLAIKMSPTTPTGSRFTPDGTMFLGDYIVRVQLDPNKVPMSGDEVGVNFLDHTAIGPDPFDFGSVANGADLILYDGATTSVNTIDYNSIDVAAGEYQPDSPAAGLNGPSALGTWEVRASDNSIGGEGQVDEVKLKYGTSKAIIQGANGVELVNVQFQGMDEVEVRQDLNNRVLLSGTLASDPKISKMLVQAGQALQAHFDSDATVKNLTASGAAEILAGVQPKSGGGYEFIPGSPDRVLEMQTANLAGQLSLASHTVVFHNANITSGGVIQVRTRDGMVNMNYGSVVPGTTSFIGASGNNFRNTANGVSMTIANSGNISSAFTAGKLTDVGTPGAATVMNVGKVQ